MSKKKLSSTNNRSLQRFISIVTITSIIITLVVFITGKDNIHSLLSTIVQQIWKTNVDGSVGEDLYDNYIKLSIPNAVKGSRIGERSYDIACWLENQTSEELVITQIVTSRYNNDIRHDGSAVYRLDEIGTILLGPHERTDHSFHGNAFIPKRIEIEIYHNLSDIPSKFSCDLKTQYLDGLPPTKLSLSAISQGYDSALAIESVLQHSAHKHENLYLFTMIPGNSMVVLDYESKLKIVVVKSWLLNLVNQSNELISYHVSEESVVEYSPSKSLIPLRPIPIPKISNQKALEIATNSGWTCGNRDDLKLIGGKMEGQWTTAWLLPYRDTNSNTVIIEATSGVRVTMTIENGTNYLDSKVIFERWDNN